MIGFSLFWEHVSNASCYSECIISGSGKVYVRDSNVCVLFVEKSMASATMVSI